MSLARDGLCPQFAISKSSLCAQPCRLQCLTKTTIFEDAYERYEGDEWRLSFDDCPDIGEQKLDEIENANPH